MNNPEKGGNLDWLNNAEERNKRFGQLGLLGSQEYSELSKEEQQFLSLSNEERSEIVSSYLIYRFNREDSNDKQRFYINAFMDLYNALSDSIISPDEQYTQQLSMALTDAILNLDISENKVRKIILMMGENDTPNFAKQMAVFKIQHPIDQLSLEFNHDESGDRRSLSTGFGTDSRRIQSPLLRRTIFKDEKVEGKNGAKYDTEEIIYRDLLKCAFESGGKNIERFLDKLSGGDYMMRAIMCWPDSDDPIRKFYSGKDLNDFQTLVRQLHSMHYQTRSGEKESYDSSLHNKYEDYGRRSISEVKKEIRTIYDDYNVDEANSLSDIVIRSFCYPLNINNIADAYDYIENSRMNSFFRHRDLLKNGKIGQIEKGDIIKSVVSADYLPFVLENGVLSKEYLGVGEKSDCTPLDTDVSMVLEEPMGLRRAIFDSSAAAFSAMGGRTTERSLYNSEENVFLVFHNDDRFVKYDKDSLVFDEDKYEICGFGGGNVIKNGEVDDMDYYDEYWYMDDRGIRTGIPASEIDYIVTDNNSIDKVKKAVKESGLYIPVTDLDGFLLYRS
ncbi:hypothetical protein J6V85_01750 [Candidatus Saccharibacteria bacterium]|nr:hypothetical protein [Candidatus Saccharibacteria bacterium]